jgi:hypothetical protein
MIVRSIATGGILLLPCGAVAGTDCRVVEFPDHVEAVCSGDPRLAPEWAEPATTGQIDHRGAQVSRTRQHLEKIRTMNAHRFEPQSDHAIIGAVPGSEDRGY